MSSSSSDVRLPNVILFGTGEYTTGYVAGSASTSDKPMGVVALTFFDLRSRGLVGPKITLCGRSGSRAAGIKQHLSDTIGRTYGLDVSCSLVPSDPAVNDPKAYLTVLNSGEYVPGDLAVVTTPDDTHKDIALACIERGIHVIIAKPVVQSLEEHLELVAAGEKYRAAHSTAATPVPSSSTVPARPLSPSSQSLVLIGEFHKRFDPIYSDAVSKIQSGSLGPLSYCHAYMSQPKSQLKTFQSWLVGSPTPGISRPAPSDISFYLNSHHIDLLNLGVYQHSRPIWVQALSAKGYANKNFNQPSTGSKTIDIEDTITVTVQYAHHQSTDSSSSTPSNSEPTSYGIAVFTSSWIAPKSDVHSQQRFHYLGEIGEVQVDQAHRGYTLANDDLVGKGLQALNPLFMRYQPNHEGRFVGQQGYGYKSFEHFVELARGCRSTAITQPCHLESLPALYTTAILQAARRSLDQENRKVHIRYDEHTKRPIKVE